MPPTTLRKIGFIGAGQMARALASGLTRASHASQITLSVFDPDDTAKAQFERAVPNAILCSSNHELVQDADAVILAVKPQFVADVASQLPPTGCRERLLISVAAGVCCQALQTQFGTDRLVRVMPNVAALVGHSASAYCCTAGASADDRALVSDLVQGVGYAVELPERLLDAVTGLSGSGPAYVFQFLEALADGGVRAGLPRQVAHELALHTIRGAAELAIQTSEHPAVLKDRVASPAGTTIEGVSALEAGGFRAATIAAVTAAAQRSAELGQGTIERRNL